jgi:hypothetical protein
MYGGLILTPTVFDGLRTGCCANIFRILLSNPVNHGLRPSPILDSASGRFLAVARLLWVGREVMPCHRTSHTKSYGHYQMDGNAEAVIRQFFDTHNFGQIFEIHRVIYKCERESNEHAHALVVTGPMRVKENPRLRHIYAGRKVLEVLITRLRRTDS